MASLLFQLHSPWLPIWWKGASPEQPLHFVLLAKKSEDATVPELVELPGSVGCRSFLAAQVDAQNRVFDWFEVQVQTSQGLDQSPAALCGVLNNTVLDAEWLRSLNETTWEPVSFLGAESDEPWVIDPQSLSLTRLLHRKTQAPLRLCRDPDLLLKAAKPAYGETLQRWFKSESSSGETHWVELGAVSDQTRAELIAEAGGSAPFIDFNASAGKIAVRPHHLLTLQTAVDVMRQNYGLAAGGNQTSPSGDGLPAALLAEEVAQAVERQNAGKLASPSQPLSALEKLYHLLSLWKEAVHAVAEASRAADRPFLNLQLNSFRLATSQRGVGSRGLQPSRVKLAKKASALSIEVEPGNVQFVPCGPDEGGKSLERFGGWRVGAGTIRFSQVSEVSAGTIRVEGFLDGQLLRDPTEATLVWVQTTLEGRSISFLAQLEKDQVGARAGVRYRAVLSSLAPESIRALKSSAAPRRPCQLSVLQPISPAHDIYHLGQLGLRILLSNTEQDALEVEDDIFEIASLIPRSSGIQQLKELTAASALNDRLRQLLASENWYPEVTDRSIPTDLWLVVIHELVEFVAIEEHPADKTEEAHPWLAPLLLRCAALERLVLHVEGLLWIPRAADEEIGRVVHRFLPGNR